ncbi:methyltransferase domain protein [Ceratobasidium sp. AG-Ba]|nr:methyltransferase domain protein [Ceratobasidium sp. AG-Ba]
MVISATPSTSPRAPTNPSSAPRSLPNKLRRQSTFERPPHPPPAVPQPLTPTLLSRSTSRSRSTPPQHTLPSASSFGESIFQSLSFGPFAAAPKLLDPPAHRAPPSRSSTMLANVLESPIQLEPQPDPAMDTIRQYTYGTSRRRVTSPDTTHPGLARAASPSTNTDSPLRLASSSPRSPPLAFGDAHPRKSKLRFSRLGRIRDDATPSSLADPVPGTPPPTMTNSERPVSTRVAARRPGSAGSIASTKPPIRRTDKDVAWTDDERQSTAAGSRTRGMRVRASSEFTRPVSVLRESDEVPPSPRLAEGRPQYAELRPALLGSSSSRLSPVPVSPGVQSTWSKKSGESALADDSDVDAPTTPSATRIDRIGSTSSLKHDDPATATPTGTFSVLGSDRTQAREDADRRRREEIMHEREERIRQASYFVLKGPGKERCHAFPVAEAPYPLSYSPRVLNHHVADAELGKGMITSITYHVFKEPPAKVLDLGCGTGNWIIHAAHEWPETHFVGFDLVPIQPSLERVTSRSGANIGGSKHSDLRLSERIRWVHGNFLERLPFEDGEFDFVRCRKIARGVPEAKWDSLYEEMVRVMKPGAAFEHLEEDIVFPTEISAKPAQSPLAVFPTPSPSRSLPTQPYLSSSSLPAGARSSVARPPDQYRRSPSTSFSSVIESPVEGRNGFPSAASTTSSASLVPTSTIATSFQPPSSVPGAGSGVSLVVPSSGAPTSSFDGMSSPPNKDSRGSGDSSERMHKPAQIQDYSFYDPRVHAKLQELFVSMHEARWINLKPLSLLPRLIQEHFVGVISAPPLNLNLPPRPRDRTIEPRMIDVASLIRVSGDALIQHTKARIENFEHLYPPGALEQLKQLDPQPGDEEVGQYLSFDFLRMGNVSRTQGLPVLPVAKFEFNLRDLPMHLSCAASDIVACKEAMWEHLVQQEPNFPRRDYDAMIRQYQTDIQDRVGLSTTLRQKLGWRPPESDFTRTPDQRAFEENYARAIALDQADPSTSQRPPALMRCLRAFVAWKASE